MKDMKTELDLRIEELEDELKRTPPGSEKYEAIVRDHSNLVKSRLAMKDAEIKQFQWEKNHALDEIKADNLHREKVAEIEADKSAKSIKRDFLTIALGTWVPFGAYVLFEERNIIRGKAEKWIGKIFRR